MLEGRFHYAQVLESSNDTAAGLIRSGAQSGTLVMAEEQTNGRGRGGNQWSCPRGQGLLFSLVLEPDFDRTQWSRLALATGVALVEVLDKFGISADIKWPNDVWISGKKCAGVLVEGCEDRVVIGVGLNIAVKEFPSDLGATSLLIEAGRVIEREALLAELVQSIIAWGSRCCSDFDSVVDAVNRRCVMKGEMIQLRQDGVLLSGMMAGVSGDGYLMLEVDGEIEMIAQADAIRLLQS
ncbi:biotin--[acetyl-CoA-carboxylase] ligase [Rubritalea sp.]|uniref:biotin--[acetyl-CoA-carboxylase] ligase n=1 Tax=Rubritalea sp. TaxID=2109375 RepID=UPI003242F28B